MKASEKVDGRALHAMLVAELARRDLTLGDLAEFAAERFGGKRGSHTRLLWDCANGRRDPHYATADRYLTLLGLHLWELEEISAVAALSTTRAQRLREAVEAEVAGAATRIVAYHRVAEREGLRAGAVAAAYYRAARELAEAHGGGATPLPESARSADRAAPPGRAGVEAGGLNHPPPPGHDQLAFEAPTQAAPRRYQRPGPGQTFEEA